MYRSFLNYICIALQSKLTYYETERPFAEWGSNFSCVSNRSVYDTSLSVHCNCSWFKIIPKFQLYLIHYKEIENYISFQFLTYPCKKNMHHIMSIFHAQNNLECFINKSKSQCTSETFINVVGDYKFKLPMHPCKTIYVRLGYFQHMK